MHQLESFYNLKVLEIVAPTLVNITSGEDSSLTKKFVLKDNSDIIANRSVISDRSTIPDFMKSIQQFTGQGLK